MLNLTVLGLAPPDLGAVDLPLPPDPGGFLGALMVNVLDVITSSRTDSVLPTEKNTKSYSIAKSSWCIMDFVCMFSINRTKNIVINQL